MDNDILMKSKKIVKEMINENPDVQISVYGISVRLGQSRSLHYKLQNGYLPKTSKYLDEVTETRKEFAKRRLSKEIRNSALAGKIPTYTSFIKKAKVKPNSYSGISKLAYEVLENIIKRKEPTPQEWQIPSLENKKQIS